jgi:hypothetical protein
MLACAKNGVRLVRPAGALPVPTRLHRTPAMSRRVGGWALTAANPVAQSDPHQPDGGRLTAGAAHILVKCVRSFTNGLPPEGGS